MIKPHDNLQMHFIISTFVSWMEYWGSMVVEYSRVTRSRDGCDEREKKKHSNMAHELKGQGHFCIMLQDDSCFENLYFCLS